MANPVRQTNSLLGSYSSPSSISASTSSTTTALSLTANAPTTPPVDAALLVVVIIGSSAPTTSPTVQFQECYDGTNFETIATYVVGTTTTTRYPYVWVPSNKSVQKMQAVITNGATNAVTAYAVGTTEQV